MASADLHTGIPHLESKAVVEAALVSSGVPNTIVGPTYFYDNLVGGLDRIRDGVFELAIPEDKPLQQLSRRDLGAFVAAVFADPTRHVGTRIDLASDDPTPAEMADALGPATRSPGSARCLDGLADADGGFRAGSRRRTGDRVGDLPGTTRRAGCLRPGDDRDR